MRNVCLLIASILLTFAVARVESRPKIKLGLLASLSDEWGSVGQNMLSGAQLAVLEINAEGGINGKELELVVEDSLEANSGAKAVSAYRKLRSEGVFLFIGPTGTPAGMALAPIIAKEQVLVMTPMVGVRSFSNSAGNIFNARGADEASSRRMAHYAIEHGFRKAGVLSSQQAWENAQGNAFREEFERLGGSVVAYQEPPSDMSDLKTPVMKIVSAKPDVLFMSNANRMPLASREFAKFAFKGARLTTILDQSMVDAAQGTLEGAVFADFSGPNAEFVSKFEKRFGRAPGLGASTSYDSVYAIAKGIAASNSFEIDAIVQALRGLKINGASGEVAFDTNRLAKRDLQTFQVVNSKIQKLTRLGS